MDPKALPTFPAGSTGRTHLLDDHDRKVTKRVAWLIKVPSHWFVGELAIVVRSMTIIVYRISGTLLNIYYIAGLTIGGCSSSKFSPVTVLATLKPPLQSH